MLRKNQEKPSGFTLIELLVVIAIISLLVSILLPSLQEAKLLSQNVICMTNLRGICAAWMIYADENGGNFPNTPDDNHSIQMSQGYIAGPKYGSGSEGEYCDWGLLYETGCLEGGQIAYCPRSTVYTREKDWYIPDISSTHTKTSYMSRNWPRKDWIRVEILNAEGRTEGKVFGGDPTVAENEELSRRSLLSDVMDKTNPETHGYQHGSGVNVAFTDGGAQFIPFAGEDNPGEFNSVVPWWGTEGRVFYKVFDLRQ
jgi:prepilin-type N-terminal cleavage/methylation domain-containing protein/prepilin-type processing-associated H-X9-DG protein